MASCTQPRKIAVITTDGFERSELLEPLKALHDQGYRCDVIAPRRGSVRSWAEKTWGDSLSVNRTFDECSVDEYDGLLIPGGALNCDALRMDKNAVQFVSGFFQQEKPVAAICHGPQMLIEAGVVEDRTLTSYPSIRTDLENAGANWVDREVVNERRLVTSRSPRDLPHFIENMLNLFERSEEVSDESREESYPLSSRSI